MNRSNSPEPLNLGITVDDLVKRGVLKPSDLILRRHGSELIEGMWHRLAKDFNVRGVPCADNMRAVFAGALYAASAAISSEQATSREISEAADRIERGVVG